MPTRFLKAAAGFLAAALFVTIAARADLSLRARETYLKGEKYYNWHLNPSAKEVFCLEKYGKTRKFLDELSAAGRITGPQYAEKLAAAEFKKASALEDSSIKQACLWLRTAALFEVPENRWSRLAREKLPEAAEAWKTELKSKNIPFQDYMLE